MKEKSSWRETLDLWASLGAFHTDASAPSQAQRLPLSVGQTTCRHLLLPLLYGEDCGQAGELTRVTLPSWARVCCRDTPAPDIALWVHPRSLLISSPIARDLGPAPLPA